MIESKIFDFMKKNNINLTPHYNLSKNKIRIHNSNETLNHFMTKARICFEIAKQKGTFFTEIEFQNKAVADVFWLDEKMVIEIESNPTKEKIDLKNKQYKGLNVIIIDTKDSLESSLRKVGLCD